MMYISCLHSYSRNFLSSKQSLHNIVASLGAEHSPDDVLFVGAAYLTNCNAGSVDGTAHSQSLIFTIY